MHASVLVKRLQEGGDQKRAHRIWGHLAATSSHALMLLDI